MEHVVAFFERLVEQFSWRRLVLLVAVLGTIALGFWCYEAFTGQFRARRMQFSAEQLARLSDPELKKNTEQDPELQRAHQKMKEDLNHFLDESQLDMSLPEPLLKAVAAAAPWILMMILMVFITDRSQLRGGIGGAMIAATPCVIVGMLLPTLGAMWVNYFVYPVVSFAILMTAALLWSRRRPRQAAG